MDVPVPWTLNADAIDRARRLVLAASAVAQDALKACGARRPAWIEADAARAARVFGAGLDGPAPQLGDMLDAFIPTTLLAARPGSGRAARVELLDDGTSCSDCVGMSASVVAAEPLEVALGDTWLLPPVHAAESERRQRWIEERLIDPTPRRERGGPYWRLGTWNRWRLSGLGWPEQLVLLGLVGTSCTASVVVGPPELVPRVGFVPASAARLQRTLVFVSSLALGPGTSSAMHFAHRRRSALFPTWFDFPEA